MNLRKFGLAAILALVLSAPLTLAQQGGGGGGGGGGSSIPGPTGTGQCFISTASGAGNWIWGSCSGSSNLAFSSLTTGTNTGATMTIGSGATLNTVSGAAVDLSATAVANFKAPVAAGLTPSANGNIGYDTTNKNWHVWDNAADNIIFVGLASGTYNANDCVQLATSAGSISLVDSGGGCGGGNVNNSGTPTSNQIGQWVDATHIKGLATTGSGNAVLATSPTLVTPTIGVATATTVNKVTLTAPATGSTLTIADGKTATISNTLTFTGTDASSAAFGAGGTVAYTQNNLSVFASTTSAQLAGVLSDELGSGKVVFATALQGTDANVLTSGTVSGTGVTLCTDAQGGATTSGCTSGGGNVSNSGTPTNLQIAQWISSTQVQGLATTGTGNAVLATSPTMTTPNIGAATATTINKVTITQPAASAVLTIATGKTLTASNTLTFTGTDSSSIAFGTGGTVTYTSNNLSVFASTTSAQLAGVISDEIGSGSVVFASALQGTDTSLLTSGTISGLAAVLCTDANGGATTSGCPSTGNTTSTSLTTNTVPKSNGANSIINSSITDDGTTVTVTDSGGLAISSSVAGVALLGQGTAAGTGTTAVGLAAPTSVTSYNAVFPSTGSSGYFKISSSTNQTGCTASSTNLCGLWEASIDLTADVGATILPGANGGTNNAFMAFTGPASTLKTFTLPNASSTILTTNAAVTPAQGGTGLTTIGAHGVMLGEGTSNVAVINASGSTNAVLFGQGNTTDPVWDSQIVLGGPGSAGAGTGTIGLSGATSGTVTIQPQAVAGTYNFNLPATAGSSGQPLLSGGGVSSPMTFGTLGIGGGGTGQVTQQAALNALAPTTTRAGDVMYYNGTNWVGLAGNNSGTQFLSENSSGVPSWAAGSSSVALSSINPATTSNTIANADNAQVWNWALTTSGKSAFTFGETTAATSAGTPYLVNIQTLATSTANPLVVTAVGTANGVQVLKSGFLTTKGTGGVDSNMLYCDVTTGTKCAQLTLSNITAANTRAVNIPDASSTTVQANAGATHNFLTAISAQGVVSNAQPAVADLSDGGNVITDSGSLTTHGVVVSSGAKTITSTAAGTTGQPLLSNGASADPAYGNAIVLGASGTSGSVQMGNATSGTVILQTVTGALGSVTASLPANTGTIAEINLAQTFSALETFSSAGAASTPGLTVSGNAYTAGSATTNFPQVYINNGASGPTTFSTAGTQFGINATSGFTGNFLDFHVNGAASVASLSATGALTVASCSGCGGANPTDLGAITYNASGTTTFAAASAVVVGGTVTATHSTSTTFSPTGLVKWGDYITEILEDSTGGGVTFTLGTAGTCSAWKVPGGGSGAITLSTAANARDLLEFTYDGTNCVVKSFTQNAN